MKRWIGLWALVFVFSQLGCAGDGPTGGGDDDDDDDTTDGGSSGGDGGGGGSDSSVPEDVTLDIPLDPVRPVDIMPLDRLTMVVGRMPKVGDAWLKDVLESPDTMWYDRYSIIPGYQDS